jgi:hypothetical protein
MLKLLARLLLLLTVTFSSCDTADLPDFCPDPIGVDYDSPIQYTFFLPDYKGGFQFALNDNPPHVRPFAVSGTSYDSIVDLGEMACIGKATLKPTAGWSTLATVALHHGYAIKFEEGSFGRFFVDSFDKNDEGKKQVNIVRQVGY